MEILGKIHIYIAVQWDPQNYRVHGNIRQDTYILQCSGNHKTVKLSSSSHFQFEIELFITVVPGTKFY